MSFYPKLNAGVSGGSVTADVYTAVSSLSTIAWMDTSGSATAIALQAELNAQKTHVTTIKTPGIRN